MTDGMLHGRVALVTGGGRGIGRSIAYAFAAQGAAVAVGARNMAEVASVAAECRDLGVPSLGLALDVSDSDACRRAVAECRRQLGEIDILVNNAGVLMAQRFLDVDETTWNRTVDVNLTGTFSMTQAVLPGMLERREGAVIAISSIAGKTGAKYHAAYAATKHGLIGLMRSLAVEYAASGVTFNSVCPAYADTPMTARSVNAVAARTGRPRQDVLQTMVTPQGRLVTPEEVAALCVFLAGSAGRGINGQAINVDGGQAYA